MPRTGVVDLLGYAPAELRTPKSGWYIEFYAVDPLNGLPKRCRKKLNRVKDLAVRKAYARKLVAEINRKLEKGWSPFVEQIPQQERVTLHQAVDRWYNSKIRQLNHSSPYSYMSLIQIFAGWAGEHHVLHKYAFEFNRTHAVAFLNYVSDVRMVGNRTYNNYLRFIRMFFAWQIEQGMRTDQPFKGFTRRKALQKTRTYLTEQEREEMTAWIHANDPRFWLACMFIYGALIRPGELKRLYVADVDFKNQVVIVPAKVSKTGHERMPAIPDWMITEIERMGLHKQPVKSYLVGSGLLPNGKAIGRNVLNAHWVRMRKALGWPKTKQLYSLRDTGIIQLLRDGVNILDVKQQAGHQDISTTNEYLKHAFPNGPKEVRERATPLQATSPLVAQPLYPQHVAAIPQAPRVFNGGDHS